MYRKLRYRVVTTRAVADGGIDIKLWNNTGEYIVMQCKNHKNKVGPAIVRDLYGAMQKEQANKAILLCSGGFNQGVFDFARGLPIKLLNIKQLLILYDEAYHAHKEIITDNFCFNKDFSCLLKNVEYGLIVYKAHGTYSGICLFETKEEAEKLVDTIKTQSNQPIAAPCNYEIMQWIFELDADKFSVFRKYKTFYYVRIIKETQNSFLK